MRGNGGDGMEGTNECGDGIGKGIREDEERQKESEYWGKER